MPNSKPFDISQLRQAAAPTAEPKPLEVTRFQVMAVLQAARAQALGLTLSEAKSWGLNRAIFYAAAKRSWQAAKEVGAKRPVMMEFEQAKEQHDPVYVLGGEKAFRERDLETGLRFKFGKQVQTPREFDRKVKSRFPNWNSAWAEALSIIQSAHRRDLDIQSRFYKNIYLPRRDTLAERWSSQEPLKRRVQTKRKSAA